MALYDNGTIITFKDNTQILIANTPSNAIASYQEHTVKDEDTLFSIARQYYTSTYSWHLIANVNDLVDVVVLEPGTTLLIPQYG